MKKKKQNGKTLRQTIGYILAICGAIGFLAAFVLSVEKIELISNPNFQPSCNVSPLISCSNIMNSDQAGVFGFPNPLMGIAGFAIVTTVGMALLAGATFKRWFWLGLQAGAVLGVVFVHWLIFQSLYRIGSLCPYCMVVWSITIPIFWYTLLYNLREKHLKTPAALSRVVAFAQKHHGDILVVWYAIIIALILNRFWYYWSSLI